MFSEFINSVKGSLTGELGSKFDLTDEQKKKILLEVENTFKQELREQTYEDPQEILDLINKKSKVIPDNIAVKNLVMKFSDNLKSKAGLHLNKRKEISGFLVISVLNKLSVGLSDENKEINLKELLTFLGLGSELKKSVKISLEEPSGKINDYLKKIF